MRFRIDFDAAPRTMLALVLVKGRNERRQGQGARTRGDVGHRN